MFIDDYIKLNDWPIKKFIWLTLTIQFSLLILIGLDFIGINIPLIREVIASIYLAYVPGIIILRILKLHKLSNIETLLYSISLSLATLMFTGLIINFSLPFLGIENPISLVTLILSIYMVTLILLLFSYYRDKDFIQPNLDLKISSKHLFLMIPLFLSIIGTYLVNYESNVLGIMILILTIAVIILLAGLNKINKTLYPFIILILSISLLFHNSLISNYITGFDIHRELFLTKLVISNFRWETYANIASLTDTNSILSITILPSYFYYIGNIDLVWIYKVVYPLLFCMVPLGLFELFKREFNSKIAFFSVIYFIASYSFFYNMLMLMREIIGEIFLVAILLLFLDKQFNQRSRSILIIIFLFSLTISHYGLAYIFLAILVAVYLLQFIVSTYKKQKIDTVNTTILVLFFTVVILWYIYNSNSSVFISILRIGDNIYNSIFTSFLSQNSTQGLSIITTKVTFFNKITKYLYLLTQLLIVVGVTSFLFNLGNIKKRFKTKKEFIFFAMANLLICISSILVPNFSNQLDTIRMFQITLITLSPFLVIGIILIVEYIPKFLKFPKLYPLSKFTDKFFKLNKPYPNTFNLISIFLVIFLLFNTGFVQEIAKEPYKPTFALTSVNDPPVFDEKEISSAEWLTKYKNDSEAYSDINGFVLLGGFLGPKSGLLVYNLDKNVFNDIPTDSYIYLKSSNNEKINVVQTSGESSKEGSVDQGNLNSLTTNKSRIYEDNVIILF